MMRPEDAPKLLESLPDVPEVSALWMSPAGELKAAYRAAQLPLADSQ